MMCRKSGAGPGQSALVAMNTPALPWRRSSVRHTSNEMYCDIIESLSVTLAPSGRPLAAFANGTVAFNSKLSGVPDIVMQLTCPSGRHAVANTMELPVFHPCVRLSRWKESPGELSFVPPDGRCILAGYEVDLIPFTSGKSGNMASGLKLPVNIEMKTNMGTTGSDFEVRVQLSKVFGAGSTASSGRGGGAGRGFAPTHAGTAASPLLEDLTITVPLPSEVRNLPDIRPSKGDATYNPSDRVLEWHIPTKVLASGPSHFSLRCTVVGHKVDDGSAEDDSLGFANEYSFDEPYQSAPAAKAEKKDDKAADAERERAKQAQNKILMPGSAAASFSIRGWVPSGIKVESMMINTRKSRGLGEGVKPYKGVKYVTVSKGGVEIRC